MVEPYVCHVINKPKLMVETYTRKANEIRKTVLRMIHNAGSSHIGSCFSVIDILSVLYDKVDFNIDKLVVSKGWSAAAVYAFNAYHGLIPKEDLETFNKDGSKYIGLIEPIGIFGCEVGSGSMGHGLPMAVGQALAKKRLGDAGKVYVVMSDGEMDCGTTWESAMIAAHHKLDNLVVIVDVNGWQAMGRTEDVLNLESLGAKWNAFGWNVFRPDGHDYQGIENAIFNSLDTGEPKVVLARTTKGKGVSFMEDKLEWHYRNVDDESYRKALDELA